MINQPLDQQINNAEGLGIRQLTQMQQTNPELVVGVALENLKQELMASERQRQMDMMKDSAPSDVIGQTYNEVAAMMGGGGQAPMGQAPMDQAPMGQAPMGLPGLPTDNMAMQTAAQGGIIGYEEGGLLDGVDNYISQYKQYMAGLASASTEEEKQERRRLWKIIQDSFDPTIVTEAHQKMSTEGQSGMGGMAGGGIVSLQEGGLLNQGDKTETGEIIVAMAGPNGVPVTEEEYLVFIETGQLPPNRNDSRYDTPTPATPLTAEQVLQKRFDQTQNVTGNILLGEEGLLDDLRTNAANPNLDTWQKQAGAAGESTLEAGGKMLAQGAAAGASGIEYLLRSLGGIGSGAGQTGVVGEGVEAVQEGIETLTGPSRREQMEVAFNERMAALTAQLNELQNTALDIDLDPGGEKRAAAIAAIQGQIDQAQVEYESAVDRVSESIRYEPSSTEGLAEGLANMLPQNISELADLLAGENRADQAAERAEAARIANLNEASDLARQKEGPAGEAGALRYMQGIGQQQEARGDFNNPPPPESEEGNNWLGKTMGVLELLGQGAGASKGYEFSKINEAEAAKQAVAEANEFDMEKQQALLDQRTDERSMLLDQQRLIARAEAMTDARADIMMAIQLSTERKNAKIRIENENDGGFFGFKDQDAIDIALAEWDAARFKEKLAEVGEYFDEQTLQVRKAPSAASPSSEGWGQVQVSP